MNVMKGISFQIKKDKLLVITFVATLIINLISMTNSHSGSEYVINNGDLIFISIFIIFLVFVSKICGYGQKDKTINYEVMSGHSRLAVYAGRCVVSGGMAYLCAMVIILFPTILVTLFNGWGNHVMLSEILIRLGLINITMFRLFAFIVLMTFICKSAGIAAFGIYTFYGAVMFASIFFIYILEINANWITALNNLMNLTTFSERKLVYVEGKDMMVCDASISMNNVAIIIFSSLLFGGIYLLLGYRVFKKRDFE